VYVSLQKDYYPVTACQRPETIYIDVDIKFYFYKFAESNFRGPQSTFRSQKGAKKIYSKETDGNTR